MPTSRESAWKKALLTGWLPMVLIAGLAARFWLATFGHNYDLESWQIAIDILRQGGNVYAHTFRYNYGPIWFNILYLLDLAARHDPHVFRALLTGFLSAVDVGIFYVLWRKFGRLPATLFFLSPISVQITGYHNQFDNLAVLLGLWAVLLFGDDVEKPLDRRKFCALAVLGLSLMTKHILFAFPLWLAVKQKGLAQKCVVLLLPVVIFLAGFAPYWAEGRQGIIQWVFHYKSFPAPYFFNMLTPTLLQYPFSAKSVWFLLLVWFAFLKRRAPVVESLLVYTAVMFATSPATTNEYLAIPLAYASVFINFFTVVFTIIGSCHVAGDVNGPPLLRPQAGGIEDLAIYALCLAIIWDTWRDNILSLLKNCRDEIRLQFRKTRGT